MKILLVEDNELNSDMLSRRLRRRGFEVDIAEDGEQALQQVARALPDLILMDLSLPKMDGLECTRRLKQEDETRGIPIIALTANALAEDEQKARQAGCDDFDTKPVDFDRLIDKISRLCPGSDE